MEQKFRASILSKNAITAGYRLSYLANFLVGPVYEEIARVHGLARSEFVVLFCLQHLGTLTAQDICEITGRPKNSISQAVTKLTNAGYISRRPDAADARRLYLTPTAAGRKLYEQAIPLFRRRESEMLAVLSDREQEQFLKLLGKLTLRSDGWADLP
jgi:MarR family transcriptional regulator, temperature-dependent positive regulator of motility